MIYGALKFSVDNIVPQKALISSSLAELNVEPAMSTFQCRFFTCLQGLFSVTTWQILEENGQHETDRLRSF